MTREKHANILACAAVTRAHARRSRARLFGARGPRQIAMRSRLSIFRRWKYKKTITLTHSLPAPCGLVRRSLHGVSAICVPVTSLQSYSQPRNMVSRWGKSRAWRRRRRRCREGPSPSRLFIHNRPDQALSGLYSFFWRLTAHAHRKMRVVGGPDEAAAGETAYT